MIVLITIFLALGIFVFDVLTPLGIGEWGWYLIPLLISFHARPRRYPLFLSAISTDSRNNDSLHEPNQSYVGQ
jgi:hypothetical protein